MEMIQVKNLNLINLFKQKEIDILVHGCNCFHTMGAGIAKIISMEYPEALKADKQKSIYADKNKLGKHTICNIGNHMKNFQVYWMNCLPNFMINELECH